ncbi:MAG: potassium transporter TrkG, partial [Bacteroidales bacterium]
LYKIWFSVFHAISAFCNAGFSILPENLGSPLIAGNNAFFCEISSLIILGGLGFPVLINVLSFVKLKTSALFRGKKVYIPFNLNSRLVLGTTALLIIGGTIFIAFFEWNNAFENLSVTEKITQAFFNSVTPRTAGFSSLPPSAFRIQTVLLVIILMWIGGGAQSTAGGIKVNTVALFFAGLISGAKRSDKIELSGRQLSNVSSIHAMAVILLSIVVIFSATIVISFMEPRIPVLNLFYEVVSAISTVGLSLDTTPMLSNGGKILIMILMFLGRIGVITVIWGIINEKKHATYSYPTENIIIN